MAKMGKRGKGRYKADKSLKDSYAFYVSKMTPGAPLTKFADASTRVSPLSPLRHKQVAHSIMEKLMDRILSKSETFALPYKLGEIRIKKLKMNMGLLHRTNNLKTDWGHYQKTGKFIKRG